MPDPIEPRPERRVLVIGHDHSWAAGIERGLQRAQPSWKVSAVCDATQAQSMVAAGGVDGLVIEATTPGLDRVLALLPEKSPRAVTALLCDPQRRGEFEKLRASGRTLLPSTGDTEGVTDFLGRSFRLQEWTTAPSMKALLSKLQILPTLPKLYTRVTDELNSPNGSLEVVSQFIKQEPVVSAKFLQVVNSASFALAYRVSDPAEAVMFLGMARTKALILIASVFTQFSSARCAGCSAERMWDHSLQTACLARGVALAEVEDPKFADMAFTGGLLHDVGKLMLAANVPEMCNTIANLQLNKRISLCEAEKEILGVTHAEVGASLLAAWNLPVRILEAVAWHHCPTASSDASFSVLTAVHAANVFADEAGFGSGQNFEPARVDLAYLARLGLGQRRNVWREACGLPVKEDECTAAERMRRRSESRTN